jgi:hypothetical protein
MGFQPAWYYERVIELEVDGGRVDRRTDRSAEMAEVRRRHRDGLTELGHRASTWRGRCRPRPTSRTT